MENISYTMTAILIFTLLLTGHIHSIMFEQPTEENHGILGRVQMSGINNRVHCTLLCLLTKNCSTFQIQEGHGNTEEADCILINSDETTFDTTVQFTEIYNMSATCEASCLNGGTIMNSTTCKCQCQTTPNITRGSRCERVCHWELLEYDDTHNKLNIFRMHNTDPETCKTECLLHENCFAITYNNNDKACDLSKYHLTNPEVVHSIGKNHETNSFVLVCSKNQTDI